MNIRKVLAMAVLTAATTTATANQVEPTAEDYISTMARQRIQELVLQLSKAEANGGAKRARYIRSIIRTERAIVELGKEG